MSELQKKIDDRSEMIMDAIKTATGMVKCFNADNTKADSIQALKNAASAYTQKTGSKMEPEMALWLDTLADNLPSCIVNYIKYIYDNKVAYNTGKI